LKADEELATIEFGRRVYAVRIDGFEVSSADYGRVNLLPGNHQVSWDAEFGVSVLVNPSGWDTTEVDLTVNLLAGHAYTVNADRTTGPGYRMYLWMEDASSGEVIAGTKKP
jgi:hypothetical protein